MTTPSNSGISTSVHSRGGRSQAGIQRNECHVGILHNWVPAFAGTNGFSQVTLPVMAGLVLHDHLSRHAQLYAGHPRLWCCKVAKTWMERLFAVPPAY